jgi:hypothetical protein
MSSQEAVHVSLMEVTPTSGKETLGTWWCHRQRGGRTQSRHKPTHEMELSCEQTIRSRGVCESALEPRCEGEGSRTRGQDFKPDLGNSAVRHYRGASENVANGGIVNPPRNRKGESGSPPPKANASEFYPNHSPGGGEL